MKQHIHVVGIGGTGLSAIAKVLIERGYQVSGSDRSPSIYFDAITKLGAQTYLGHAAENVIGADLVIRSSAITDENPEVLAAISAGIPVLKRSDFLEILTSGSATLAVAGTHGKTTTTGMLISILTELNQDPSFIIGALVKPYETNAKSGNGPYFVIEADEYDHMFLGLNPTIAVITNIEHDHPDCFPTPQDYLNEFKSFAHRVKPDGDLLLCIDDEGIKNLLMDITDLPCKVVTFGTDPYAEYQATNVMVNKDGLPEFDMVHLLPSNEVRLVGRVKLSLPGMHNVYNALAALIVSHIIGIKDEKAIEVIESYHGTERRFEVIGTKSGVTVIDDYAHHPTQITTTIKAARQRYHQQRIWVIWEPHTYTRPAAMEDEYIASLDIADQVIVTRIYAAREMDNGYTPLAIVNGLSNKKGRYIPDYTELVKGLRKNLKKGDIVMVLSAGNGPLISKMLLEELQNYD